MTNTSVCRFTTGVWLCVNWNDKRYVNNNSRCFFITTNLKQNKLKSGLTQTFSTAPMLGTVGIFYFFVNSSKLDLLFNKKSFQLR
jgi:hypothetical protein